MTRGAQRRWRPQRDGCAADRTSGTLAYDTIAVAKVMSTPHVAKGTGVHNGRAKVTSDWVASGATKITTIETTDLVLPHRYPAASVHPTRARRTQCAPST